MLEIYPHHVIKKMDQHVPIFIKTYKVFCLIKQFSINCNDVANELRNFVARITDIKLLILFNSIIFSCYEYIKITFMFNNQLDNFADVFTRKFTDVKFK